jgi:hypothetical protein
MIYDQQLRAKAQPGAAAQAQAQAQAQKKDDLIRQQTDISTLPFEQLNALKDQLLEEQESLKTSFRGLREACVRFQQSLASLKQLTPDSAGKEVLVRTFTLVRLFAEHVWC